jgi:O-glycosyl hydrolase
LDSTGKGLPNPEEIEIRRQLKELARKHGIQVWMTEVSHSEADSWDTFRARTIQIHDEMLYTGISSYWGMCNMYDKSDSHVGVDEDNIVNFNSHNGTFKITGMGYAIGHYARWIKRGAVRVDSVSSEALLQVSAFHDKVSGRLVLVVINNSTENKSLDISLDGVFVNGLIEGEQSTGKAYWKRIDPVAAGASGFSAIVPPESVTTFAAGII